MTSQEKASTMFPSSERNAMIKQKLSDLFSCYKEKIGCMGDYPTSQNINVSQHDLDSLEPLSTQDIADIDRALVEYSASKSKISAARDLNDETPSFSLGLTQTETHEINEDINVLNIAKECAKDSDGGREAIEVARTDDNIAKLDRPRRQVHLSDNAKSPYVIRIVNDLRRRQINPEQEAVWQWLFSNRKRKEYAF